MNQHNGNDRETSQGIYNLDTLGIVNRSVFSHCLFLRGGIPLSFRLNFEKDYFSVEYKQPAALSKAGIIYGVKKEDREMIKGSKQMLSAVK